MDNLSELELLHFNTIKEFLTVLDDHHIKYGKWSTINNIAYNDEKYIGKIEVKTKSLSPFKLRFLHGISNILTATNEGEMYLTSEGEIYFEVYLNNNYNLPIKLILTTEY